MSVPAVSVIVPVYNAEKYLHRCIDSILTQTFVDFELLLIDDGSKDRSGAICDEYAAKDKRIRVFHKENGGVSSARNLGLDHARGEWITFVDSDDSIPPNALDLLSQDESVDLVVSGYIKDTDINCPITPIIIDSDNQDDFRDFIIQNYQCPFLATPWAKLFKRSIIRHEKISFDENLKICEDAVFVSNYLLYVKKIKSIKEVCYIYTDCLDMGAKYTPLYINDIDKIIYLYDITREVYNKLNSYLGVTSIKSDCSIMFGLFENAIVQNKYNKKHTERFCSFLRDTYVIEALKKRKQKYIDCLLLISKVRVPYLVYVYMRSARILYNFIKRKINSR